MTVYRGIPASSMVILQNEYKKNRPIYWSSFTSTTPSLSVAKSFAKKDGIIMSIQINTGKRIKEYSILPGEDEILLLPNTKLIVTEELVLKHDGFYLLEMKEEQKAFVF